MRHAKLLITALIAYLLITPTVYTQGALYLNTQNTSYYTDESLSIASKGIEQLKSTMDSKHSNDYIDNSICLIQVDYEYKPGEPPVKFSPKIKKGTDDEKVVFLTIDDGPSSITSDFLKVLKTYNVQATFCITGNRVSAFSQIVKRIYDEGHSIINHSYNHQYKEIYASPWALINSLERCNAVIDSVVQRTETERMFMRFPGGASMIYLKGSSRAFAKVLQSKGYNSIDWNVSTEDCSTGKVTMEFVRDNAIKDGDDSVVVILMHDFDHRKVTVQALPYIIEHYKKKGYLFRTIKDMTPFDLKRLKEKSIANILY